MKLNIVPLAILLGLSLVACPLLYIHVGPALDAAQLSTLKTLLIICGASALWCFVVGEISRNNSQMDKLWSILPIVYTWVIAADGGFKTRLVVMAVLATLWGCRLTFNFARKGAYTLKFWEGEEDYRWKVLRQRKEFSSRWVWMLFDLLFICVYQNVIVLLTTFPALVAMSSDAPFGAVDILAAVLMFGFILYETVADEQQWAFQSRKWAMIKEGKALEELYLFSIGAGAGIINWSIAGALLLVVLFLGSSAFGEAISASKYPLYADYCNKVSRYIPWRPYA